MQKEIHNENADHADITVVDHQLGLLYGVSNIDKSSQNKRFLSIFEALYLN